MKSGNVGCRPDGGYLECLLKAVELRRGKRDIKIMISFKLELQEINSVANKSLTRKSLSDNHYLATVPH